MALSSAAVLTVYSTGYLRTRAAADKLLAGERPRVVIPTPRGEQPLTPGGEQSLTGHEARKDTTHSAAHDTAEHNARPQISREHHDEVAHGTQDRQRHESPAPVASPVASASSSSGAADPLPSPMPAPVTAPEPSPTSSPTPAAPLYKDGTFSGWGTSRHGDIEATVVIESGKITSAVISQCWTRYSCSWVAHLQGQVVARQSAEVDYVTGATQSANAFYYAVVQALSKAK